MMEFSQFVSPKELLKIKRDIVEEALARANPIVALEFKKGILLLAENPSSTLNKIAEIYDRIAFAGTGVYNDYEKLRRAGVQYADLKGFAYSRKDVKAKAKIIIRVDKMELGLFGDIEPIGDGLSELRIHYGLGYRVYYGKEGNKVYLLLCGPYHCYLDRSLR